MLERDDFSQLGISGVGVQLYEHGGKEAAGEEIRDQWAFAIFNLVYWTVLDSLYTACSVGIFMCPHFLPTHYSSSIVSLRGQHQSITSLCIPQSPHRLTFIAFKKASS